MSKKQRRKAMLDRLANPLYEEPTARLENESIARIRNEGFIISTDPFFGPNHTMPNGYIVFRVRGIIGNSLKGYEGHFIDEEGNNLITDGPSPTIYSNNKNGWSVAVNDYAPGPGPGDFNRSFEDESQAIDEVIRYLKGTHEKFKERQIAHEKFQTHFK